MRIVKINQWIENIQKGNIFNNNKNLIHIFSLFLDINIFSSLLFPMI